MVRPVMKFIATTKDKLSDIVVSAGQLIFVQDDRAIYLDVTDKKRTIYQTVITVDNEQTRRAIVTPIDGFYYVSEENTLWSYFNSTWIEIIGKNTNIVFLNPEDFPSIGVKNTLYVKNNTLYTWDEEADEFVKTQAAVDWENIDIE